MIIAGSISNMANMQPMSFVLQSKSGASTAKVNPVAAPHAMSADTQDNKSDDLAQSLSSNNSVYGIRDEGSARLIKPLPLTEAITGQLTTLYASLKPDTELTETFRKTV